MSVNVTFEVYYFSVSVLVPHLSIKRLHIAIAIPCTHCILIVRYPHDGTVHQRFSLPPDTTHYLWISGLQVLLSQSCSHYCLSSLAATISIKSTEFSK